MMASREHSLAEICRPEGWYFDSADGTRAICWSQSLQAVWSGKITGVNVLTAQGDLFVHRTRVNATVSVLHYAPLANGDIRLVVAQIIDRGPPIVRPKFGEMISDFARVRMPVVGVDEVSAVAAHLESGNFGFLPTRSGIASNELRKGASGAPSEPLDDGYDELELSEYWRAQGELRREKADWSADWFRYVSDDDFEDGIDDDHWYVSDYGYSDGVDSGYW
ncbi:hypothetical protein [Candidatus Poriferisodalis sp.]|uniref:hypothetical protein n=1 Tax=Candidatus Poriferisodalis sp. TaxID=3101277 RepID=UPI003B01E51C